MTQKEVQKKFNSYRDRSNLSLEEAIHDFQLCLALGEQEQAIASQKEYELIIHNTFLEIALNIDKKEYYKQFVKWSEHWKFFSPEIKNILLSIMYRKRDNILYLYWDDILEIVKEERCESVEIDPQIEMVMMKENQSERLPIKEYYSYTPPPKKIFREKRETIYELVTLFNIGMLDREVSTMENEIYSMEIFSRETSHAIKEYILYCEASSINFDLSYLENAIMHQINIDKINPKVADKRESHVNFSSDITKEEVNLFVQSLDFSVKQSMITINEYDYTIIDIALFIVEKHPIYAYDLLSKLHVTLGEVLDVQSMVSKTLFKQDIELGIEYFKKIEVGIIQLHTFCEIAENSDSLEVAQALLNLTTLFKDSPICLYRAYFAIKDKITIPFEKFYDTAIKITPSEFNNYDLDYDSKIYKNYVYNKYMIKQDNPLFKKIRKLYLNEQE